MQDIHEEEHYYDFARDIGLRGYELFSQPYFAHKLMQSLPPGKELTSQDISEGMKCVFRYLTTSTDDKVWCDSKTLPQVKRRLEELEAEVQLT